MLKMKLALTGLLLSIGSLALASGYDIARVVDVQPIVEIERYPVDQEVCRQQDVWVQERHSHTPTVVGAIIGGVLGSQFGSGSGRRAATAAGAMLGGSIAHDSSTARRDGQVLTTRQHCEMQRSWRERTVERGYRVTYDYNGRLHRTVMNQPPGDTIRVQVAVTPVGH